MALSQMDIAKLAAMGLIYKLLEHVQKLKELIVLRPV